MNFTSAYANLPTNLRVKENLGIFAQIYGVKNSRRRIAELLETFGIPHLANALTGNLSSGESTRVNLCKALLNRPELLLLDEPTASLDPDIADTVRTVLKRASRELGLTMVYTSHNMRDIESLCDRIVFIHHGKVIARGTPAEITASLSGESLEDAFIQLARDKREPELSR